MNLRSVRPGDPPTARDIRGTSSRDRGGRHTCLTGRTRPSRRSWGLRLSFAGSENNRQADVPTHATAPAVDLQHRRVRSQDEGPRHRGRIEVRRRRSRCALRPGRGRRRRDPIVREHDVRPEGPRPVEAACRTEGCAATSREGRQRSRATASRRRGCARPVGLVHREGMLPMGRPSRRPELRMPRKPPRRRRRREGDGPSVRRDAGRSSGPTPRGPQRRTACGRRQARATVRGTPGCPRPGWLRRVQ